MRNFMKLATVLTATCISLFALSAPAQAATGTKVTGVQVSKNYPTVFPAKDGYRDEVKFKVSAKTSGRTKVHGSATLKSETGVVKTWKITKKTQALTWNGRDRGTIVPGTYTLTVREAGSKGTAKITKTSVKVSAKKLVTQRYATRVTADELFAGGSEGGYDYTDYSEYQDGSCSLTSDPGVLCISTDAYKDSDGSLALTVTGAVPVPSEVQSAVKRGAVKVTVSQAGYAQLGREVLLASAQNEVANGSTTIVDSNGNATVSFSYSSDPSYVFIGVGFAEDSTLAMTNYDIVYTYTVLK